MHVHPSEIQTIAPEIVVAGDRDLVADELAVLDRSDEDVEVSRRLRRHVGQSRPVGREPRVHVDLLVGRQRPALAGRHIHDLQLNRSPTIVRDVDDPPPVGRPVGHRVVLPVVGELPRLARCRLNRPDRAAHRDGDRRTVRRPGWCPGSRARRRRKVVVVHVVRALPGGAIGAPSLAGDVGDGEEHDSDRGHEASEHRAVLLTPESCLARGVWRSIRVELSRRSCSERLDRTVDSCTNELV